MKKKDIIWIIAAVVFVAAAVTAIIVFRKQIGEFFGKVKEKAKDKVKTVKTYTAEEFEDFADI